MTIPWVQVFVDVPHEQLASAQQFWSAAVGGEISSPWDGHPEFVSLTPPTGQPYVHLQEIGRAPRVHLDLVTDHIDDEVARLVELGAKRVECFPGGTR